MTKTGLKVKAKLDKRKYPLKVKVSDEDMASLNVTDLRQSRRLENREPLKAVIVSHPRWHLSI
jgi:hypothetical protein